MIGAQTAQTVGRIERLVIVDDLVMLATEEKKILGIVASSSIIGLSAGR